jgi:hypothetical protein
MQLTQVFAIAIAIAIEIEIATPLRPGISCSSERDHPPESDATAGFTQGGLVHDRP